MNPGELTKSIYKCDRCPLHDQGKPVLASGPVSAKVMFIGEAPGWEEQKSGVPFVGASGRFLNNELLPLAGLRRSEVRITNTVMHRPPDNRDPFPEEISACKHWLDLQLKLVNPLVIVLLGRFAMEAVLGISLLMKDVGGKFVRRDGRLYMISMHPAAALHAPKNRQAIIAGFTQLGKVLAAYQIVQEEDFSVLY